MISRGVSSLKTKEFEIELSPHAFKEDAKLDEEKKVIKPEEADEYSKFRNSIQYDGS